ncbi:ABC transporter ATP-binding protein [Paenibacillus gallinarum]|uniref:ABC transporter ATP-binding protein n=1 Tax=Paenibacillus gallinarum TaxID=2762232 RepID=A0ABR8SSY4_9BACL|nr:ABC transporter ATP-binding protein [Paenibacillus gallinarum]MBD7966607.1 ABC transporter ATP-binding protein [Paenibacillus gallinarum]
MTANFDHQSDISSTVPVVEARALRKEYSHFTALDHIHFNAEEGDWWGIVGPNGSGKSTLLHLLSGILSPNQGTIHIKGKPVQDYSRKELSRIIAVLQQDGLPEIGYSVRDVVAMGRYPYQDWLGRDPGFGEEKIEQVLKKLDLTSLAERRLDELSGGQRQRVALAKVMVQEPEILLLDEPTTFLDVRYQLQFMDLLAQWQQSTGITIIAVLHDLNLASLYCDYLCALKEGKLFLQGSPAEVLTEENIRGLFEIQPVMVQHPDHHIPQFLLRKQQE